MITVEQAPEVTLIALCIWREAEGESKDGKIAVGCVIRNRVRYAKWYGNSWWSVILKPYQFSSFNRDQSRATAWPKSPSDQSWIDSLMAAKGVYEGNLADITDGADFYYADSMEEPPNWAAACTPTVKIGAHNFFRSN